MTLFNSEPDAKANVHVEIFHHWKLWWWRVRYKPDSLFNQRGITFTQKSALSKAERAVRRIVRYEQNQETFNGN